MPVYNYECEHGHLTSEFRRRNNKNEPTSCEECGANAERDLVSEVKSNSGHVFEPYVDHNLTDKPEGVKVESKKHKEQLKEERGLIEVGEVG